MEDHVWPPVVKPARLLADIDAQAGIRYEETRLAREAPAARRKLAWLLAIGAAALSLEALLQREPLWLVGTIWAGLAAHRVRAGTLGGLIMSALTAAVATILAITLLARGPGSATDVITLVLAAIWGALMLPHVVLLARDAELQHAYGMWARRD